MKHVVDDDGKARSVTPPAKQSGGKKAREGRLNDIRVEVQARLAKATPGTSGRLVKPRYDDVFTAGVQWLDQLAGEPVPETEGKLTVTPDVWKSDTRRAPEIP